MVEESISYQKRPFQLDLILTTYRSIGDKNDFLKRSFNDVEFMFGREVFLNILYWVLNNGISSSDSYERDVCKSFISYVPLSRNRDILEDKLFIQNFDNLDDKSKLLCASLLANSGYKKFRGELFSKNN